AVAGPGGGRELQTAVVAVAGVDGPVAAGLALGDGVPLGGGGGGGVAGRHQRGGDGGAGHTGDGDGASGLGRTTVLALAGKQHGWIPSPTPTRGAVGFGPVELPGHAPHGTRLHPKPHSVSTTGSGTYLGSPAPAYGA